MSMTASDSPLQASPIPHLRDDRDTVALVTEQPILCRILHLLRLGHVTRACAVA